MIGRRVALAGLLTLGLVSCSGGGTRATPPTSSGSTSITEPPVGGDGSGRAGGPSGADGSPATSSTLSTGPASGAPIKVGFIHQQVTDAAFPNMAQAVEAAVQYLNTEGGGAGGRPLAVVQCTSDGTEASSKACADQMVSGGVVAVMLGVDFGSTGVYPTLATAGIPVVGGLPLVLDDFTAQNAYFFVGSTIALYPGLARFAVENLKATNVVVVHSDQGSGEQAASLLAKAPLERLGAKVKLVAASPERDNFDDVVPAVVAANPQAVIIQEPSRPCAGLLTALRQAKPDLPLLAASACRDEAAARAAGNGSASSAEGAYFAAMLEPAAASEPGTDVALFNRLAGARSFAPDSLAQVSFSAVFNLREVISRAIASAPADGAAPTPAAVVSALRSKDPRPSFMGEQWTCSDGSAQGRTGPPIAPAVCNDRVRVYREQNGRLVPATEWFAGTNLIS